jgi:hypothetical protein
MPRLLGKAEINAIESDPSHFTAVKSYKEWDTARVGVRDRIMRNLTKVQSSITDMIGVKLRKHEKAKHLFYNMLSTSVTWLNNWVRFIDEKMKELTIESKFSPKSAWSLTTMCAARMIRDVAEAHAGLFDNVNMDDQSDVCAALLYGTLRAQDVMTEFTESGFKDHPSVSAEHVKFLATHSGSDAVSGLDDRVKAMEESLKEALKKSKEAMTKADTASNSVDKLKNEVKMLEQKVDKKQDKT